MSHGVDGALRELRRGVEAVPDPESESARRERIGSRVSELQRGLVRRDRARRRFGGLLLAAAALAGAVVLVQSAGEPTIKMARDDVRVSVIGGRVLVREDGAETSIGQGEIDVAREAVVLTDGESAVVQLASRAALELTRASRVKLSARSSPAGGRHERVRLLAGRVALDVPKLAAGEALAVETHDSLVEVRGTRFAVSVVERAPQEPFTRVDVSEGRVLIRLDDGVREVAAGQSWSSGDAALPVAPPAPAAAPPQPAPPAASPPSTPAPPVKASALGKNTPEPSDLAAQNRLLDAAELAKQSRMPELALERFERLIERYPDSELAENARVARFRLLAEMSRLAGARAAARDYLARHPRGFARDEARRLLDEDGDDGP